jgi:hypothetical protein
MSAIRNAAIVLGTTALVAGGAGAYVYFNGVPGGNSALNSAKLVPDDAVMAAYLSTDAGRWNALNQFGTPEARKLLDQGWTELKKSANEGDSKVSLEKDILPWVDGVMFSILPTSNIEAAEPIDVLLVVGVKSPDKALKFKAQIEKEKGVATVKSSTYKGENISEVTYKKGTTPMNVAVLNGKLVMGTTRDSVEQAIDTYKGAKSMAAMPAAQAMLEGKGSSIKNPIAQVYIPSYSGLVNQLVLSAPTAPPLPPETLKQLALIRSVGTSIGIEANGLRMQSIAKVDPTLLPETLKAAPSEITKKFPAQTVALFSGFGIADGWTQFTNQAEQSPEMKTMLDQARAMSQQALQIDLDRDIFGWMEGEYAIGFVPVNTGVLASAGIGPALVIDSSDRSTTDEVFEKMGSIAQMQRMRVDEAQVGSLSLTQIKPPSGINEPILSYGWLTDKSMLIAMGGPTVTQLAQPKGTLDQSANYKTITLNLPQSNVGQGYVDVDQALAVMQRLKAPLPADSLAILQSIRGFAMASTIADKETMSTDMQLVLRKTGEAAALP